VANVGEEKSLVDGDVSGVLVGGGVGGSLVGVPLPANMGIVAVGDLFSNAMNQEQGNTKDVKYQMSFVR
jgi:repressor of nif and glnA expression